jgi:hypothetical protein
MVPQEGSGTFPENQRVSISHPLRTSNGVPSDFGAEFPTKSERIETGPISPWRAWATLQRACAPAGTVFLASDSNPEFWRLPNAAGAKHHWGLAGGLAQGCPDGGQAPSTERGRFDSGRKVDASVLNSPAGSLDP